MGACRVIGAMIEHTMQVCHNHSININEAVMSPSSSLTYFDQVSATGARILESLGGSPAGSDVDDYLELVGKIYEVLAQIHDGLIDVTIDVSQAQTMEEARQVLAQVEQLGLKEALKAQDLCDELQRLGQQLRGLPYDHYGLTTSEKATWYELFEKLEQREAGTSRLYDEKLYELRTLPHTDPALPSLKAKVEEISNLLVIQKAQFERLAKLAKAIRARR